MPSQSEEFIIWFSAQTEFREKHIVDGQQLVSLATRRGLGPSAIIIVLMKLMKLDLSGAEAILFKSTEWAHIEEGSKKMTDMMIDSFKEDRSR